VDSALSYAAAQTYKPTIMLGYRQTTFGKTRMLFNGFSISGPAGVGTEFRYNNLVNLNTPGTGWLDLPAGQTKGVYIGGLCFQGNSTTSFFVDRPDTGQVLWGSDSNYFTDGLLIDSPNTGTGDRYHLWAAWSEKTTYGPMFITAKSNTTAMRIDGGKGIIVNAARMEAQQGSPSWGSQLLITGGTLIRLRDPWFFNGMSPPSNTGHSNPAFDKGIVTITGGSNILIDGAMFSNGDGDQTTSTPAGTTHDHVGGGSKIRIRDIQSSDAPKVVRASAVPATQIVTDPDVPVTVG
jgi:hypothetical protein